MGICKVTELEIGHQFITVYGTPHSGLLQVGTNLWHHLRTPYRELNRQNMRHIQGDPMIYHPYGNPIELGRDPYQHFHIITPGEPTREDLSNSVQLLIKAGADINLDRIKVTRLEDNMLERLTDVQAHAKLDLSKYLLSEWLDKRTETITELLTEKE